MSTRSFTAIQKAFVPEAEELFGFLVRDFDFIGPEYSDLVIQVADLGKVVSAAGIQDGKRVRGNVHSLKNLRKVLEEYARLVGILQPYLTLDATVDLMRKAGAREWHAS